MSRFRKLSHTIWHCQYHIVWARKYRYRILSDKISQEVENCIVTFSQQLGCEVIELNVQIDHVHLLVMVPPKVSISGYVGTVKGKTAIRVLNRFRQLKQKPIGVIIFGPEDTVLTQEGWTQRWFKNMSSIRKTRNANQKLQSTEELK